MNYDVFFTMGRAHTVCQDYATVGTDMVALSDGCSSSKHTDFGARLLCRQALKGWDPVSAVKMTLPHLEAFGLPTECLDATLLLAGPTKDGLDVEALITGDGIVVARKRKGGYTLFLSEFPTGAPRYASYDLDPSRRARYLQEFKGVHRITLVEDGVPVNVHELPLENADVNPFTTSFAVATYDMVLLLSDGALSFHRPGLNGATEQVPYQEVVAEMLDVKGFAGEFILRRARAFLKKVTKEGWAHDDDFSVAAIYLGAAP